MNGFGSMTRHGSRCVARDLVISFHVRHAELQDCARSVREHLRESREPGRAPGRLEAGCRKLRWDSQHNIILVTPPALPNP
jgi:hypothetical protein